MNRTNALSVVIVNYRCWDKLSDCLNSLLADNLDGFLDIIVVDNQSNDGRFEDFTTLFPSVRFTLNEGNYGFANGCNLGASLANAPMLLFLNPDTIADRNNLEILLQTMNTNPELGLLSCRQIDEKGRNQRAFGQLGSYWMSFGLIRSIAQNLFPERYSSARKVHDKLIYCDWISGSVVMISRKLYDAIDGWDESFWMYCEDTDLSVRVSNYGLKIGYEPAACITHLHGGASRSSPQTKAITKAELIVSKHVFIEKHEPVKAKRRLKHFDLFVRRVIPVMLLAMLTLPTLILGKPHFSTLKFRELWRHYSHWRQTGHPNSARCAVNSGLNMPKKD